MAFHIITGRRDAPRTAALYDALFAGLDSGKRVYLVLPEQATFLHERQLEAERMGRSLWDLEITSFRRLAESYLPGPSLDDLGRSLMVYDILADHRDEFAAMKPKDISVGFIADIVAVLKEVAMNGVSADVLRETAAAIEGGKAVGDLDRKLRDIALICEALAERDFHDESGRLFAFAELIAAEGLFADAVFCFDDFYDFTSAEFQLIRALNDVGADFHFAFLWDRNDVAFAKTDRAVAALKRLAAKRGETPLLTEVPSPDRDDALAFLERSCFRTDGKVFHGRCDAVAITAAADRRTEVRDMAQKICDLAAAGVAWDDIGVCFRDLTGYDDAIDEIFASYGIPCFIDKPVSLLGHPLYRFAAGLLRVAAENWSFDSVFSLLKSGLFPIDEGDCDLMENYCLAHAIKGRRFYQEEPWTYRDEREHEDPEKVDAIRRDVVAVLKPMTEAIKGRDSVVAYATAIWQLPERCRCDEIIESWRAQEEARGHLLRSAELASGVTAFGEMLDQLVTAFPRREMSLREFMELLKMAAAAVTVRTIPLELHTVEISEVGRGRPARRDYVFLGGVNEGIFPAGVSDGGFLNITDRDLLKRYTDLWVQDKDFYHESEDILVYQALTMAKKGLFLSYSLKGDAGRAEPSPLIATVKRSLAAVAETTVSAEIDGDGVFGSVEDVLGALPLSLRENVVDGWEQVKAQLLAEKALAARTERILSSLTYTGASHPLSDASLQRYPGDTLALNVTAIERFRNCPFAYFSQYGLKLQERKILRFTAPDVGNIFHDSLRELTEIVAARGIPWENLGDIGDDLVNDLVTKRLAQLSDGNLFPEEQLVFIGYRLAENLRFVVEVMARRFAAGDRFIPTYWEVRFGDEETLPALELPVGGGKRLIVRGVIDRVDVAENNGETFLRVIDYKSSDKDIGLDDLYYGTMPQLPVYMMVLEEHLAPGRPGGMYYQTMSDAVVRDEHTLSEEKLKEKLDKSMAMKGYTIGDHSQSPFIAADKGKTLTLTEYERVREHTKEKIVQIGKDIFAGRTEIRPYRRKQGGSCQYCSYSVVCGYEPELMGREDRLPSLKDAEAMERIIREEEGR